MKLKLKQISKNVQDFLMKLSVEYVDKMGSGIPVYLRSGDKAELITDYTLPVGANRDFESGAGEHNLYRGGAVIFVETQYGRLVLADDRYSWFKPFAGIAERDEGSDLRQTGERELEEEAFVTGLDQKVRYVPRGIRGKVNRLCTLGFSVNDIVEVGETSVSRHYFNNANRSYEVILSWDISELSDFTVISHEEWFRGGHSGIVVYAFRDGRITGNFSGQQGFISVPDYDLHPSLR